MTLRRGASIDTLKRRAQLLAQVRQFFAERSVCEVDTASLSAAATPDPALVSLRAECSGIQGFLHTSPEYMMKRLLADGSGDIYQLCRVYRGAEHGRWHEPEFMLLEWYRLGFDEHALMLEVESLLTALLGASRLQAPTRFVSYDDALEAALGETSDAPPEAISGALHKRGISVPGDVDRTEALDLAMSTVVCGSFPDNALTFIYDYPVNQAALACINENSPPRAARFEVFLGALELGNGFRELTNAAEQRRRFERENQARVEAGLASVPLDEEFLAALEIGLPPCSGVALGFDRIVAAALRAANLADVLAFTHARATP